MTDSQLRQTTSFSQKRGNCSSPTPPRADHVSYNQGIVGDRYGWVEIINPEKRYTRGWSGAYVEVRCVGCGRESWINWANLSRGKTKGCQPCSQPLQIPSWLTKRIAAAQDRCKNPNNVQYYNYGGRGIEFRFDSVLEAGLWVMENLGLDRNRELDRHDNEGHYEAGNLRWATRHQQASNKRDSKIPEDWSYDPQIWPYERYTVMNKLRAGYSREEILAQARLAVVEKRKGWRRIAKRLASLTS